MLATLNQIIHGDCLGVMPSLPDESVDMILCDLPYGTTECKWDSIINLPSLWKQYNRLIKPDGAIVLTTSQPFTTQVIASNLSGFTYAWVWDKKFAGNYVRAKFQPMKVHEDVIVFTRSGKEPRYFPQKIQRNKEIKSGGNVITGKHAIKVRGEAFNSRGDRKVVYTDKYPESILHYSSRVDRGMHPTQKPVALFEYLIRTYTQHGEVVLDNCAGSGTTGVAALNSGRKYILIEKELEYYEICLNRLNQGTLAFIGE